MAINTNTQPIRTGTSIRDYVDEVKLRLHRLGVISSLNPMLIATFVNQSRREAQSKLHSFMPERFGKIVSFKVTKGTAVYNDSMAVNSARNGKTTLVLEVPMPDQLINVETVIMQWKVGEELFRSEARVYGLRELFEIGSQEWTVPSIFKPAYAVDRTIRQQATGSNFLGSYVIYLSGLSIDSTTTLFDIAAEESIDVEVWYTMAVADLEWGTDATVADIESVIPTFLEEYVILQTLDKCLRYTDKASSMMLTYQTSEQVLANVAEMYIQHKKTGTSLLPSKEPM